MSADVEDPFVAGPVAVRAFEYELEYRINMTHPARSDALMLLSRAAHDAARDLLDVAAKAWVEAG